MVTPVINNIVPFDAQSGTTVSFIYTGGITDSYVEIFDTSNTLIYDSRNDARVGVSQLLQKVIPSATDVYVDADNVITANPLTKMVNNAEYYMQITVINGEETSTSQKKLFRCITTPTLSVYNNDGTETPLENSYILTAASLDLYATYSQALVNENTNKIYEDLNCYQFILYDNSYQKIYTSDVYYHLTDDEGNPVYTRISGLEEKRYFLKVIGKTINGYVIDNDLIAIDVEYQSNTQKTTLFVENCYEEGFVKVGTNIHALLYRLGKNPAAFIENEIVDLKDNWLEYYDGLSINGDYLAYFRFRNPQYNKNLVRISGNEHNVYMNCYKYDTYMSMIEMEESIGDTLPDADTIKDSYLYFDLQIHTNNKVEMLVSDKFFVKDMENEFFNVFIARVGSVYSFLIIDDKGLIEYNLSYELDGGENDVRNPLTYKKGEVLTLYEPTKPGHTFCGWYSDENYTASVPSTFTAPKGDMSLYSKWEPNVYSITYKNVDGAKNENPSAYTYGTSTVLVEPTKDGYTFEGWYIDENFTLNVTAVPNDSIGDIVLYAKWNAIQYTIAYKTSYYNSIDGTITSSTDNPTTYHTGDTFELSDAIPVDALNYQFDGWYTDEDCTEECKITALESSMWGALKLYAKLTPKYDFKYTWYINDYYTTNTAGWLISFTSLATTKDEIHIPTNFNEEPIIGCQSDILNLQLVKPSVKFTVNKDNMIFRSDDYGNLYLKEYPYFSSTGKYYNSTGTSTTEATLLHFCDENKFNIAILSDVTAIGSYAFRNCENLTTIVIPSNITLQKIKDGAFWGCSNLSDIYICNDNGGEFDVYSYTYYSYYVYCRRSPDAQTSSTAYKTYELNSNCTIHVKNKSINSLLGLSLPNVSTIFTKAYIDKKQTISTDYDWETPDI